MAIQLIGDSSCDCTPQLREELGLKIAPLKVTVGRLTFIDDERADVPALLQAMAANKDAAQSACPSPEEFARFMWGAEESMVITLSSKLSGSYNAACIGRDLVLEEYPEKRIHIFDSESAAAGETQIALLIRRLEAAGDSFEQIVEKVEAKIAEMHTLFVLEDLGNFIKSGRIGKVIGVAASLLSICPIMSDDGHGDIRALAKVRGVENSLKKLVDIVREQTAPLPEKSVVPVLVYCNCPSRAENLRQSLLSACPAFSEIRLIPSGILSSMYANSGGVVLAY